MARSEQNTGEIDMTVLWTMVVALAVSVWLIVAATDVQAQTFTVLHTLNGGSDGSGTANGLAIDQEGNLYGTAVTGGISNCPFDPPGCGTVFKLSRHNDSWIYTVLYSFSGVSDGFWPQTIAVGPDGSLYGTTIFGGNGCGHGCGTVFRLQPPATFCRSVSCPWTKTTLFQFGHLLDGAGPSVTVTFDSSGNIYGGTNAYGENGLGTVWELARSGGGCSFQVLYALQFTGGQAGNGVVFDAAGNLWGSGDGGDPNCGGQNELYGCGVIWELTPSASGWNQTIVFNLDSTTGGGPNGTFRFDQAGNLYGTLTDNGLEGNGGVFQFAPSSGQYNLLYAAPGDVNVAYGPQGGVVMDGAGNIYAADPANGPHDDGYVIRLTPSNGHWIYTDLHDFAGGSDGSAPYGPLVVDAEGNVYGANAANVIFEITR